MASYNEIPVSTCFPVAVSLGVSGMYRDDLAQLEACMSFYEAFYRWARDATTEGHDWPAALKKA